MFRVYLKIYTINLCLAMTNNVYNKTINITVSVNNDC